MAYCDIVLYMHCAKEGHKLDLIRANPLVCVEIENDIETVSGGEIPCEYGSTYSSVIARGKIRVLDNPGEKIHGLNTLMKHQTGKSFEIDESMSGSVEMLEFVSDSFSAKSRKMPGRML